MPISRRSSIIPSVPRLLPSIVPPFSTARWSIAPIPSIPRVVLMRTSSPSSSFRISSFRRETVIVILIASTPGIPILPTWTWRTRRTRGVRRTTCRWLHVSVTSRYGRWGDSSGTGHWYWQSSRFETRDESLQTCFGFLSFRRRAWRWYLWRRWWNGRNAGSLDWRQRTRTPSFARHEYSEEDDLCAFGRERVAIDEVCELWRGVFRAERDDVYLSSPTGGYGLVLQVTMGMCDCVSAIHLISFDQRGPRGRTLSASGTRQCHSKPSFDRRSQWESE